MRDLITPGIGITQGLGVISGIGNAPLLGAQGFGLKSLFANGERGAILDPSRISTVFQDMSGTTPSAAGGDPIAMVLDTSGNPNDATQSAAEERPTYQSGAMRLDGVDDNFGIASFDMPSGASTLAVMVKLDSAKQRQILFNFSGRRLFRLDASDDSTGLHSGVTSPGVPARTYVNGQLITGLPISEVHALVATDAWVFLLVDRVNFADWSRFGLSDWSDVAWRVKGDVGPILLIDRELSSTEKTQIETAMWASVGLPVPA